MDEDQYISDCISRDMGASEQEISETRRSIEKLYDPCRNCKNEIPDGRKEN